jgi:branched-chain amino acid transport system ATP-binding protein
MTGAGRIAADRAPATPAALHLVNLGKSFGGVQAVADVSLEVAAGSLTALIGPNGAGKTTLFNLITNLFVPSEGEVFFYGTPLAGLSSHAIAGLGLIRTFQTARVFPGMTTLENVMVGAHLHLRTHAARQMLWTGGARREERELVGKAEALLDLAELAAYRDSAATDLPIGAQKLVEVLRAVMARPRLLLLDEPAAGLNDSETAELAALLRAVCDAGTTIVVVEHNMSLVMGVADRVIVLDAGRIIAAGRPAEIQGNPRVIEVYLGRLEELNA